MTTGLSAIRPAQFPWFRYDGYSFSLGLTRGDWAYLSGHSASEHDPESGRMVVRGGMQEQARTSYAKIARILEAADLGWDDVVRVVENVTTAGLDRYAEAEGVRREVLGHRSPAVTTVVVDRLLRPAALLEVEVTARRGGGEAIAVDSAGRAGPGVLHAADDVVHLPTVLPVGADGEVVHEGDLVAQTEFCFRTAARLLEHAGLSLASVVKTLDYTTPATLRDYRRTGSVRRELLSPPYPGSAGILVSRLHRPGVLVALDVVASRAEKTVVDPGWSRYGKLTYSPAVRAGNVLWMSGQAALDVETEQAVHAGDVAAQAEHTYRGVLAVLAAAGLGPEHLVKTVEYVTPAGLPRYKEVARVRKELLREPWPASTGVVCAGLLRPEFEIEVDPTALFPDGA